MEKRLLNILPPLLMAMSLSAQAGSDDDILILEDDSTPIVIDESNDGREIAPQDEQDSDILLLDENESESPDSIELIEEPSDNSTKTETVASEPGKSESNLHALFDEVWLEYGNYRDSDSVADHQGYAHTKATVSWSNESTFEMQASARVDGYTESGENDWDDVKADYDETFIRYKSENTIVTLGAQKILWGRIDEFPPTDRLSTQDLRRFVLDDLADRRLASPALRVEQFFASGKLDLVFYPTFREAELPDKESSWYPVNQKTGEVLGLETNPLLQSIVKTKPIKEDTPDSEGGFGLSYNSLGSTIDYAITIQKGRQNVPYFRYSPARDAIETVYPRSWTIGGSLAFEALGGTLKFEGAWLSDIPVTKIDGSYTTVEGYSWGGAWEVFPGDGDMRLNLQIIGQNLVDAPDVFDRKEIYAFNGSIETPFADNQWQFKTRFYAGLKDEDYYLNPEITYIGWDSQEIYMAYHLLEGSKGTFGGYYDSNDFITLGWRVTF